MAIPTDLGTDLTLFAPELVLLLGLVVLFLLDGIVPKSRSNYLPTVVTVLCCLVAGWFTYRLGATAPGKYFSGLIANDRFANFFRYIFLASCILGGCLSYGSKELLPKYRMEFALLLLSVTFGLSLMANASHLLVLYLGLETVSIISFVLAGFSREDIKSNEASLKYFVFGALGSAVMVYGISILYGLTGSLTYSGIAQYLQQTQGQSWFILAFSAAMIFAGIAYKISAFPMHFWTPDVYEGAPTPVVGFFSVAPKAAGIAALLRVIFGAYSVKSGNEGWLMVSGLSLGYALAIISAITMVIGNFCAIGQTNVKRMLAYSSIAHIGYMLMGIIAFNRFGLSAMLFYILAYCAMNFGAFWAVSVVRDLRGHDDLDAFNGTGWTMPVLGTCMAVFLFSLTGIPLFAGFVGKWYLFGAIVDTPGYFWLAVLGVLNSVVSLFYYAKILKAMWLIKPSVAGSSERLSIFHGVALVGLAVPTVVMGIYFGPVIRFLEYSLSSF